MPPRSRLESKYAPHYLAWKQEPSPERASQLLQTVKPAIDRGIQAHIGQQGGPALRSHARYLALQAIRTYDPRRAQLSTHIINNLQGLKRIYRRQTHVLSVPERVSLDRSRVITARTELKDRLGREASIAELADYTRLSPQRLAHIERFRPPLAEGTITSPVSGESTGFLPAVRQPQSDVWLEVVYHDLDPVNQNIMDWGFGMHEQPQLNNQDIAHKLSITPGAVSQRKATIQTKIDQREALELI